MYIFAKPLGYIIRPIYELIQNYGLTLIIVTILIRIATIPLTIMSQKSTTKTQMIQPEMAKIQEKYKNKKNEKRVCYLKKNVYICEVILHRNKLHKIKINNNKLWK